jgi:hypothetical protein
MRENKSPCVYCNNKSEYCCPCEAKREWQEEREKDREKEKHRDKMR